MENVNPVDSNEYSKIATSSLATLSSSGYNSGENVPEEGKSPPLRKSVSLKDLDSSKTTGESTIVLCQAITSGALQYYIVYSA